MADPTQLQAQWLHLKGQLDRGELSAEEFQNAVTGLQVTDEQGVSWSVDPESGALLRRTGSEWPAAGAPTPPETLLQLVKLILKGAVRGLGSGMVDRMKMALMLGGAIWLVHTLLLIGPNGGFNSENAFLDHVLALGGWKFFGGTVLWTGALYVGTILYSKRKHPGIGPFFRGLSAAPAWVTESMANAGSLGKPVLMAGLAFGLTIGVLTDSSLAGATLGLMLIMSLATGRQSLALLATRLGWSDLQRWRRPEGPWKDFREDFGVAFLGGMVGGFAATILVAPLPWWLALVAVVAAGMVARNMIRSGGDPTTTAMGLWILFCLLLAPGGELFADDGGWAEAGGGFWSWITSEGAPLSVLVGLGPAAGGVLGWLMAITLGDLAGILPVPPGLYPPTPPPQPPVDEEPWEYPGDPGTQDRESRWVETPDGRVIPQIYDAKSGLWRTARHGDVDREGQVLDMTQADGGAFVSSGIAQADARQRMENERFRQEQREKLERGDTAHDRALRAMREKHKQDRELWKRKIEGNYSWKKMKHDVAQEHLPAITEMYKRQADYWDKKLRQAKAVKATADVLMNGLGVIPGAGTAISKAYTVGSQAASEGAEAYVKKGSLGDAFVGGMKGTARGAGTVIAQEFMTGAIKGGISGKGMLKGGVDGVKNLGKSAIETGKRSVEALRNGYNSIRGGAEQAGSGMSRIYSGWSRAKQGMGTVSEGMKRAGQAAGRGLEGASKQLAHAGKDGATRALGKGFQRGAEALQAGKHVSTGMRQMGSGLQRAGSGAGQVLEEGQQALRRIFGGAPDYASPDASALNRVIGVFTGDRASTMMNGKNPFTTPPDIITDNAIPELADMLRGMTGQDYQLP